MISPSLSWIEISRGALENNVRTFRRQIGAGVKFFAVVKANAYGHGVELIAPVLREAGVDGFAVYSIGEGLQLRELGVELPVIILGYAPRAQAPAAIARNLDLTVFSLESLELMANAAREAGRPARVHLKTETGTHRQGMEMPEFLECLQRIAESPWLQLHGLSMHFANIEDTTEHSYAHQQEQRFREFVTCARNRNLSIPLIHTACTAAAILFPDTYFSAARVGIGLYGLWPSKETYLSSLQHNGASVKLQPVLTWKTMVGQVKSVPAGAFIGYGCSYRTTRKTLLAVLPLGYADGYGRHLGNAAHVLIHGQRAPVRGRICMNVTMTDVSDHPQVKLEDEVVLLGRQGEECVSAEFLAGLCQTINYEFVTRLSASIPRRLTD